MDKFQTQLDAFLCHCSRWPCFGCGAGVDPLQRTLPTPTIPCFCHTGVDLLQASLSPWHWKPGTCILGNTGGYRPGGLSRAGLVTPTGTLLSHPCACGLNLLPLHRETPFSSQSLLQLHTLPCAEGRQGGTGVLITSHWNVNYL